MSEWYYTGLAGALIEAVMVGIMLTLGLWFMAAVSPLGMGAMLTIVLVEGGPHA